MQTSTSDIIDTQFLSNPEQEGSAVLKKTNFSKDSLSNRRKLIQKQLKALMLKVDEYQFEKNLINKKDTQQDKFAKRIQNKEKQLLQTFEKDDIPQSKPIVKQLLKQPRYQNMTPFQQRSRSNNRVNSQKLRNLPLLDKNSKFRESEQRKYINYIPQVDFRVPLPNKSPNTEKKKQRLINYLQKAQEYEKAAIRQIAQIKRAKVNNLNYMQYIQVQSQVDNVFANSMRARLQCAMKM